MDDLISRKWLMECVDEGCDKGTLLKWKRHKTASLDVELADKALKALGVSATIGKE